MARPPSQRSPLQACQSQSCAETGLQGADWSERRQAVVIILERSVYMNRDRIGLRDDVDTGRVDQSHGLKGGAVGAPGLNARRWMRGPSVSYRRASIPRPE